MPSIEQHLKEARINELTLREPIVVDPKDSLRSVMERMRASKASCVLVCAGGMVAGIFTERDILTRLSAGGMDLGSPIEKVMTANPKTLGPEDRLGTAIKMMTEQGYRHVPLVDENGRGAGLLTAREILTYIAEHFPAEVVNLPPRLHQTPRKAEGG